MRCSYQTPGGSWACGNMNAHHSPPPHHPVLLDCTQQVLSVATPIRPPHLTPRAKNLLCYAIGRWQFIHEDVWYIFFFWHGVVVMLLVKGLCVVFLRIVSIQSGLVFLSALKCEVILGWIFILFIFFFTSSFPIILSLDWAKTPGSSTAVNSVWRLDRSLMRLRPNDWTVFVRNFSTNSEYIQCEVLLSWKPCWWEGTGSVLISNAVHH